MSKLHVTTIKLLINNESLFKYIFPKSLSKNSLQEHDYKDNEAE